MKIKHLFLLTSLVLVFNCSQNETTDIEDVNSLETKEIQYLKVQMEDDYAQFFKGLETLLAEKPITNFFDSNLDQLNRIEKKSPEQIEILKKHFDDGINLIKNNLDIKSKEAINRIESGKYDLVLIDYDMDNFVSSRLQICSENACANSISWLIGCGGCTALSPGCCAFLVGISLHCC